MHLEYDASALEKILDCENSSLKTVKQWVQMNVYQKILWADLVPLHFWLVLNLSGKEELLKYWRCEMGYDCQERKTVERVCKHWRGHDLLFMKNDV